jgi:hypothetical protein
VALSRTRTSLAAHRLTVPIASDATKASRAVQGRARRARATEGTSDRRRSLITRGSRMSATVPSTSDWKHTLPGKGDQAARTASRGSARVSYRPALESTGWSLSKVQGRLIFRDKA